MLIRERRESQCRESGHNHKRRVEKNQASLGKETILCKGLEIASVQETDLLTKDDQACSQRRSRSSASSSLQSQEHGWHKKDTADSRQQSHRNVRHSWLEVVLSNVFEVEFAIESS